MKLLLDTHLLLWAADDPKRLPKTARVLIEDAENELLFSAASDAYYALLNFLLEHRKQALVVIKDERREVYEEAAVHGRECRGH